MKCIIGSLKINRKFTTNLKITYKCICLKRRLILWHVIHVPICSCCSFAYQFAYCLIIWKFTHLLIWKFAHLKIFAYLIMWFWYQSRIFDIRAKQNLPKNFEILLFAHLKISHLLIWLFNFGITTCLRIGKTAHLLNSLLII